MYGKASPTVVERRIDSNVGGRDLWGWVFSCLRTGGLSYAEKGISVCLNEAFDFGPKGWSVFALWGQNIRECALREHLGVFWI
ncbi:hypothetical protein FUAX_26090 [Fulvitalea axinellae]|uniref:Uncharacterized protein n=1 Tax=Fulvitalea axinellae TaxID=1182444 RepID=A0AAU9CXJ8_9BACT|nr:hypothetical protein FUAX_26090 [Fulvitalea axinellae]